MTIETTSFPTTVLTTAEAIDLLTSRARDALDAGDHEEARQSIRRARNLARELANAARIQD